MPIETVDIDALISEAVKKYGLNRDHFYKTLACESEGFRDVSIQSEIPNASGPNGREDSWGVAQIHLPDHPEITRSEAQDPAFAIDWAGQQWAAGQQRQWTCWRNLNAAGWQ